VNLSTPSSPVHEAIEDPAVQTRVAQAVTALFVPGDRPDRYAKAASSGADVVIIDLEDAVAPEAKADALRAALEVLGTTGEGCIRALVRVNPAGTQTHEEEVTALLEMAEQDHHGLLGLMVPKAEGPQGLERLGHRLTRLGLALVPLVESASGVMHALEVAQSPGVTRLAFGAVDYALDLDADDSDRVLDYPRSVIVAASRAAGVAPPLDSPSTLIRDTDVVAESARRARGFGFGGKLCIHPHQVEIVDEAFRPTAPELQWARSVVGVDTGAAQLDGQMIDRPVIERARRILARAKESMA
jgi:citrate lyase subunit beta / citryl-CoA lyase